MADRILIWHIPRPGAPLPAFYMDKEYVPKKVRIHAEQAPNGKNCEVDIRDDGISIFSNRATDTEKRTTVYSEIQYNTLTGTFRVGEFVTGGTSGARGTVVSDKLGNMTLTLWQVTVFTVGETITGAASAATAVVRSWYRGGERVAYGTATAKTTAVLPKGQSLEEDAEDLPEEPSSIEAGSILTCHEIEMGGANNVTVQLELESVGTEEDTESD